MRRSSTNREVEDDASRLRLGTAMKTIMRRLLHPRQNISQRTANHPIPQDPTHSSKEQTSTPLHIAQTRILLTRLFCNVQVPHIIECILSYAEYWRFLTSCYTHVSQLPNNGRYHPSCLIAETPPLRPLRPSISPSSTTSERHPPQPLHLQKVVIQLTSRRGHGYVLGRDRECCSWFELMVRRPRAYGPAPNPNSNASTDAIECAPGRNFALRDDESAVGRRVQPDYGGELNPMLCDIEATVRPPVTRTFTFFPGFALAMHQHQDQPVSKRHYTPFPPGTIDASSTNPRFFEDWKRREDGAYDHHGTNGEDGMSIPHVEACDTYGDVGGCMALIRGLEEGDRLAVVANVALPAFVDNVESVGIWVYVGVG